LQQWLRRRDHLGLRGALSVVTTMVLAIVAAAASALGFYFAEALWMWFPLRIVFHGAITILFVLSEFWINTAAPPSRRGLVLGIYATVLSLGFAAGPLIFSIVGSEGILPFAIGAGIILLAAIPVLMARKENPVIGTSATDLPFMRYVFLVPTATAAVFVFGAVESGGLSLFPDLCQPHRLYRVTGRVAAHHDRTRKRSVSGPYRHDRRPYRGPAPAVVAVCHYRVVGSLALPFLIHNWMLTAIILLFWGGSVAGLYTVGLAHLGDKLHGSDLASANAAFVFCYALGMLVGPQTIGVAMDVTGHHGFAWALAFFFGLYVALTLFRLVLSPKQA
jgi:MFS family permease